MIHANKGRAAKALQRALILYAKAADDEERRKDLI